MSFGLDLVWDQNIKHDNLPILYSVKTVHKALLCSYKHRTSGTGERTFKYFHTTALFDATERTRLQLFSSAAFSFLCLLKETHLNENKVGVFVVRGGEGCNWSKSQPSANKTTATGLLLSPPLVLRILFSILIGRSHMQHLEPLRV